MWIKLKTPKIKVVCPLSQVSCFQPYSALNQGYHQGSMIRPGDDTSADLLFMQTQTCSHLSKPFANHHADQRLKPPLLGPPVEQDAVLWKVILDLVRMTDWWGQSHPTQTHLHFRMLWSLLYSTRFWWSFYYFFRSFELLMMWIFWNSVFCILTQRYLIFWPPYLEDARLGDRCLAGKAGAYEEEKCYFSRLTTEVCVN